MMVRNGYASAKGGKIQSVAEMSENDLYITFSNILAFDQK